MGVGTDLSSIPSVSLSVCWSVGRSVCLSRKCTVAKRLTGSGCHLGWWVGSVEGIRWGGDSQRGRGNFGHKCGVSHCYQWDSLYEGGDEAFPKLLWDFSFLIKNACSLQPLNTWLCTSKITFSQWIWHSILYVLASMPLCDTVISSNLC